MVRIPKRIRPYWKAVVVTLAAVVAALAAAAPASPTGSGVIAFASYRGGVPAIYAVHADGGGEQQLTATPNAAFDAEPAYSPDGTRIAYVCGNFELCVMNADGSGQMRLTTSGWPARWEYADHPSWSPDSTKIAFASNRDGNFAIYVVNADGSGLHRVSGSPGNDEDPAWSPDGTKIAFDSDAIPSFHVYVMNADGSGRRRLTTDNLVSGLPSWSPDGRVAAGRLGRRSARRVAVRSALAGDRRRAPRRPLLPVGPAAGRRRLGSGAREPGRRDRVRRRAPVGREDGAVRAPRDHAH